MTRAGRPKALAGEIGDTLTWELAGLAAVPASSIVSRGRNGGST